MQPIRECFAIHWYLRISSEFLPVQVSELLLQFLNGASNWMIQLSAFAGGVAAVAASYLISRKSAHSQTLSLVLTGTMIMSLCNAGVTMIKYVADPNDVLQQITFWLMGSLTKTTTKSFSWSLIHQCQTVL